MSMQQVPGATFAGFSGPFYPPLVAGLADALTARSSIGMMGDVLDQAAEACPGYRGSERRSTNDGYAWFRAITFNTVRGYVIVTIPMACDEAVRDGKRLDRSPAVYVQGQTNLSDPQTSELVNAIVARLTRCMWTAQGIRP